MGEALLSGSALAAFLAGMVAFFAPCCAFVMLPTYLASMAGASRWRTAVLLGPDGHVIAYGRLSEKRLRKQLALEGVSTR
jgi:cytochrome c biogenesis protein CcdA